MTFVTSQRRRRTGTVTTPCPRSRVPVIRAPVSQTAAIRPASAGSAPSSRAVMTSALIVRAPTRGLPLRSTICPRGNASHSARSAVLSVLVSTRHILVKATGRRPLAALTRGRWTPVEGTPGRLFTPGRVRALALCSVVSARRPQPRPVDPEAGPDGRQFADGHPRGAPSPVPGLFQARGQSRQMAASPQQDGIRVLRQTGERAAITFFDHDASDVPVRVARSRAHAQAPQEIEIAQEQQGYQQSLACAGNFPERLW